MLRLAPLFPLILLLAACTRSDSPPPTTTPSTQGATMNDFAFSSPAFEHGQPIPRKYTGDGADVSPPLVWSGTPANAKAFALIVDDPDAPTHDPFVHWVLFNIPASVKSLPEGIDKLLTPKNLPGISRGTTPSLRPAGTDPPPLKATASTTTISNSTPSTPPSPSPPT